MIIGLCELFIHLPNCHSLKDKRSVIKSLKSSIRKKYNISIAEIGYKDSWKRSTIGIGCVGDNRKLIDRIINKMINELDQNPEIQLINFQITIN